MKKISLQHFSIIFYIGVVFGLLLTGIAVWADLEAAVYGFDRTGGERLGTLACPILMTVNETSSFSVKVTNTTNEKLFPNIKTDVTTRLMPVSSYTPIVLEVGESKRVDWTIGPENLELGQFIFVRARVYGTYPLPNRENTCGVFIVNLPTNGNVITWILVGFSLLGIVVGRYGVIELQNRRVDILLINLLAALVVAGIITSFMGWWIQGVIVIAVSFLLIVVSSFLAR